MVNNTMDNSSKNQTEGEHKVDTSTSPPNETSSFTVHGHVKIFDPETQEVFVEKRA